MRSQEEKKMCREFVRTLRDYVRYGLVVRPESFRFWHNDNGQRAGSDRLARAIAGKEAKDLGVMRGLYDYTFLWRDEAGTPFIGFLEAKTDEGTLTEEQEGFRAYCIREKIPNAEFRAVDQGIRILKSWGVLKGTGGFQTLGQAVNRVVGSMADSIRESRHVP